MIKAILLISLMASCTPAIITIQPQIQLPKPVCIGYQYKGCTPIPRCDEYLAVIEDVEAITQDMVLDLALCQRDREEIYQDAYQILRMLIEKVNESRE